MKHLLPSILALAAAATAQTYTLHEHGSTCGADLRAHLVHGPHGNAVDFGLHGQANALAVLAIGFPAPTPIPLPGGHCHLLVDHVATMLAVTDAHGEAGFVWSVPPGAPFRVDFQGVVVGSGPHAHTLLVAASDVAMLVAH